MKKQNAIVLLVLWAVLALCCWLLPGKELSDAERRPLAQMPEISADSVLSGTFMEKFESYTQDQFPLRQGFRTVKSLFHYYVLGQKDNNGIYMENGFAVKQEYPLNEASLDHAVERFTKLYEKYLTGSDCYMAIVPDKGYYLAEQNGYLSMDYDKLFAETAEFEIATNGVANKANRETINKIEGIVITALTFGANGAEIRPRDKAEEIWCTFVDERGHEATQEWLIYAYNYLSGSDGGNDTDPFVKQAKAKQEQKASMRRGISKAK